MVNQFFGHSKNDEEIQKTDLIVSCKLEVEVQ